MKLQSVAMADIAVIDRQRTTIDNEKLAELALDIKQNGLLHPIVIRTPRDGEETHGCKYVLVVGERRLRAHKLLGEDNILARVFTDLSELDSQVIELSENIRRDDMSWQDVVRAKQMIHKLRVSQDPTRTIQDTAEEVSEHFSTTSRDIKVAEIIAQVPELAMLDSKAAVIRQFEHMQKLAALASKAVPDVGDKRVGLVESRLVHSDWMDFTKTLDDGSVHLVCSDLPYAIDNFAGLSNGEDRLVTFDDTPEKVLPAVEKLVPELVRITAEDGWIVLFFGHQHADWLASKFRDLGLAVEQPHWIWHRSTTGPQNFGRYPDRHAYQSYDAIVVVNRGKGIFLKKPVSNVLSYEPVPPKERFHIHEKPRELARELIERFTMPGHLVVDVCFGSGVFLEVAADMHRRFAGCDNNEHTIVPARQRVITAVHVETIE